MGVTLSQAAGLVVLTGLFFMVLHSVYKAAERVPAASGRTPAGVANELLVVVGAMLALGFYRLAEAVNIFSWVESAAGGDPAAAVLFATAGPSFAASILSFLAVHRLAVSRSRQTPWLAAVLLWSASLGHTCLRPIITALPQEPGEVVVMAGVVIVCTLCLFISRRVKNTYSA